MLSQLDDKWTKGDCLNFRDDGAIGKGRPTRKFSVYDRKSGCLIGYIRWFAQWRQYVFYPLNVPLMGDMLDDILTFVRERTAAQKRK